MSEEKELPILSAWEKESLLPEWDKFVELSAPMTQPELTAPPERLLLTDHTEQAETIVTPTQSDVEYSPVIVSETIPDMSDPTIFDTVLPADKVTESDSPILDIEIVNSPSISAVSDTWRVVVEADNNIIPTVSMIEVSTPQSVPTEQVPIMCQPSKSHRLLLVIVALVLLVAGTVIGWYFYMKGDRVGNMDINYTISTDLPAAPTYADTVIENIRLEDRDIENMNRALSENSIALCEEIQSQSSKTVCNETLNARNISTDWKIEDCQSLTLPDIRTNCISVTVQSSALKLLDRSICSQITDPMQSKYCIELVDKKILSQLIEDNTASIDTCSELTDEYKSECLSAVKQGDDSSILRSAISDENLEACKKLSTEDLQFNCFDTILLKQALKSWDKNLCDYVRDSAKKTTCLSYIDKKDDNAVFKSAIIEKNLWMCRDITMESLQNRCHDSVTLLLVRDTKNPTLCDTLIATGSIESCKQSINVQ